MNYSQDKGSATKSSVINSELKQLILLKLIKNSKKLGFKVQRRNHESSEATAEVTGIRLISLPE
jgi:hypothetical protein